MEPPPYTELESPLEDWLVIFNWEEVTTGITPQAISPKIYEAVQVLSKSFLQIHLAAEKARKKGKKKYDAKLSKGCLIWSRLYWRIAQTFDDSTTHPVYVSLLTIRGFGRGW